MRGGCQVVFSLDFDLLCFVSFLWGGYSPQRQLSLRRILTAEDVEGR